MSVKWILPVLGSRLVCVGLMFGALSCCLVYGDTFAASTEVSVAADIVELPLGSTVPYSGALTISADGRTAAHISADGEIVLWEPDTFKLVERIPLGIQKPSAIALNASGEMVAIGSQDSQVVVWSRRMHKVEREFNGHSGFVSAVAFSLDSRRLASGGIDGSTQVWDVQSGRRLHVFGSKKFGVPVGNTGGYIVGLGFSADGRTLVTDEWYSGQYDVDRGVTIWDIDEESEISSRPVAPPNIDSHPRAGAALGKQGGLLVYTGKDGLMVQRLNDCGALPQKMSFGKYAETVAVDWRGRWVAAAETYKLTFSDVQTGGSIHSIDLPNMVGILLPHPDGRSVFALLENTDSARNVLDGRIYRIAVPKDLTQIPSIDDSRGRKSCRPSPERKVLPVPENVPELSALHSEKLQPVTEREHLSIPTVDLESGKVYLESNEIRLTDAGKPIAVASRLGTLAVLYDDYRVRVWQKDSGAKPAIYGPLPKEGNCDIVKIELGGDGRYLLTEFNCGDGGDMYWLFDFRSSRWVQAPPFIAPLPARANRVVVPDERLHHLAVYDLDKLAVIARLPRQRGRRDNGSEWPLQSAISDDGRFVAFASYDGLVRVWDIDARKLIGEARIGKPVAALQFDSSGRRLTVSQQAGSSVDFAIPGIDIK